MSTYILNINPHTKPRMTRRDSWGVKNQRKCVSSYYAFKDLVNFEAKRVGLPVLSGKLKIQFHIEMPESWSQKKKTQTNGQPHRQVPDIDNCLKALFDCLLKKDEYIYSIKVEKYWSLKGKIVITIF